MCSRECDPHTQEAVQCKQKRTNNKQKRQASEVHHVNRITIILTRCKAQFAQVTISRCPLLVSPTNNNLLHHRIKSLRLHEFSDSTLGIYHSFKTTTTSRNNVLILRITIEPIIVVATPSTYTHTNRPTVVIIPVVKTCIFTFKVKRYNLTIREHMMHSLFILFHNTPPDINQQQQQRYTAPLCVRGYSTNNDIPHTSTPCRGAYV